MWAGVVLPEGAVVAGLPAFNRFAGLLVAGVRGEFIFDGPTTDAGAVGFKIEATVEFTGGGAIGGGWLGRQQFGQQRNHLGGPVRMMIAAGQTGRPGCGPALGAGEQIVGAQLIEAAQAQAQFEGDGCGREQTGTGLSKEMADQWR